MASISEKFMTALQQSDFPSSLIDADTFPYHQKAYAKRLNDEKSRLFCEENDSALGVLQRMQHNQGTHAASVQMEQSTVTNRARQTGKRILSKVSTAYSKSCFHMATH